MYEDTYDQAKATLDVKRDMEASSPMDRLICGDVGFGKTEVAVRAAFKAVMCRQTGGGAGPHDDPGDASTHTRSATVWTGTVSTSKCSRASRPRRSRKPSLHGCGTARWIIVIGTHRLLSKDVSFKDLGLLIIDEEHRFGVTAKEKLRQLRAQVDTLTLTATPIPRTLHFSLLGARDLSLIATPPRNRLPIVTEIAQWNDDLIRDAIRRELQRGGQVYFVHDRIQTMDDVAARLQAAPAGRADRARRTDRCSRTSLKRSCWPSWKSASTFCCRPRSSNRAWTFRTSTRSSSTGRIASAWRNSTSCADGSGAPTYRRTPTCSHPRSPCSAEARFSGCRPCRSSHELGSGFNLAMRDLEIRGAGNLLGSEQSGFIEMMGFETYTRILEEAVHELKQEEFQELFQDERTTREPGADVVVETDLEAFIPGTYVENETERLTIYRRLYAVIRMSSWTK